MTGFIIAILSIALLIVSGYAVNVTWHFRRARQACVCGRTHRAEIQSLAHYPLSIIDRTTTIPYAKRWRRSDIVEFQTPPEILSEDEI